MNKPTSSHRLMGTPALGKRHRNGGSQPAGRANVLLGDAPCQLRLLAGPEHGRTILLADMDLSVTIENCRWFSPVHDQ
jgi:hypothetical protein